MPTAKNQLLLLDTHVWIWLMNGDPALKSTKLLSTIEGASRRNSIRIASITLWEVAMLESKGRIRFPIPCLDWINQGLQAPGISLVELSPDIAVDSSRLPAEFHGDPADRILVATARKLGATLATEDQKIKKYASRGHVSAIGLTG